MEFVPTGLVTCGLPTFVSVNNKSCVRLSLGILEFTHPFSSTYKSHTVGSASSVCFKKRRRVNRRMRSPATVSRKSSAIMRCGVSTKQSFDKERVNCEVHFFFLAFLRLPSIDLLLLRRKLARDVSTLCVTITWDRMKNNGPSIKLLCSFHCNDLVR